MEKDIYYAEYLQLDRLLDCQHPKSAQIGKDAHDELLFIIIHQAYELWFKQILYELDSVIAVFQQHEINDNAPDLQMAVHRLKRVCTIWQLLIQQVEVLETMTPLDFLDFRDLLIPASGFQSFQFRYIEAKLGLKLENRHLHSYYVGQFEPQHIEAIRRFEQESALIDLVDRWLQRMPFLQDRQYWSSYRSLFPDENPENKFWADYRLLYQRTLLDAEAAKDRLATFDELLGRSPAPPERNYGFSPAGRRSALFITLYRSYPLLQLPFQLLDTLLEIDQLMSTWRYRHMSMVRRMIGMRIGTGGTTGKGYLQGAVAKNTVFGELAQLSTLLIERSKLPDLPASLERELRYSRW